MIKELLGIVLIIMIVMTAIAYPKLSIQYGKALFDSGIVLFKWTVSKVKEVIDYGHNNNGTTLTPSGNQTGRIPENS